jgi:WD40 repeat protein
MSSGRVGGETHSEVADMAVAVDKVYSMAPAPDASVTRYAVMSHSTTTLNYKPHPILSGHKKSISSVKFSPDGNLLASAGVSLSVFLYTYLQTV